VKVPPIAIHNAAHLVMLCDVGLYEALHTVRPPGSGCVAGILHGYRRETMPPLTRQVLEQDAMVLLAGIVGTQNLHPARSSTEHGLTDTAAANVRLQAFEDDVIVLRSWILYLRHRTRSLLLSNVGQVRVATVAEMLSGAGGYEDAVAYLAGHFAPAPAAEEAPALAEKSAPETPQAANEPSDDQDDEVWQHVAPQPEPPTPPSPLISDVLSLTTRTQNCLTNAEIITLEQLSQYTERELASLKNVGRKTLDEIITAAAGAGIVIRRMWRP
jgi:hypothetical protein